MDYGQMVMDNEFAGLIKFTLNGIPVNDKTLAIDVIHEIGHFKDYLGHDHTMQHMRSEQTHPKLIDRRMRSDWLAAGATTIYERSWGKALEILENYKPEPLPPDVQKTIRSVVEETEEEFGLKKE